MEKITYQKRNGDIIHRIRTTGIPYRVGETTSMGWKVLDIKYNYNGKFYSRSEYDRLLDKAWDRDKKITKFKKNIARVYHEILSIVMLLIFFRVIETSTSYII